LSQSSDDRSDDGQAPERWRELALTLGLSARAVRRARLQLAVFAPLFAGVILIWEYRDPVFALRTCFDANHQHPHPCDVQGTTVLQIFVVLALVILGWTLARDVGRGFAPWLSKRTDAATAGSVGFVIRLLALLASVVVALRIAEVSFAAIAIGASFSAVVFGLAAQQTLGNLIAGVVLLSARPFRVGDTVRLQGGMIGGQIEGVVTSLGLLYTTFNAGGDPVLVPNSAVLAVSISPLREPEAVSLRARLRDGRSPVEIQRAIEERLTVAVRRHVNVVLEEVDGADVVYTISATPRNSADGGRLASEMLDAVTTGEVAGAGAQPAA
jgi:small-conductance mechanosensitive channel